MFYFVSIKFNIETQILSVTTAIKLTGFSLFQLEASVLMQDDFVDNAGIRNKKPTWYSLPHIGKTSVFHAMFTGSCVYILLQKYFSKHPQYKNILETFQTCVFHLNFSQVLDAIPFSENNLTQDFLEVSYFGKGEQTTFTVSATIAMYLAGIQDPEIHQKMKRITTKLGRWLQIKVSFSKNIINHSELSILLIPK